MTNKKQSAIALLSQETTRKQLQLAVPRSMSRHLTPDRMNRICLTEFRNSPALLECDPITVVGSIVLAAQMGLEPGGALGHCYLVPYKKRCQLIVGYRGMVALARRSGEISSISSHVVRRNDQFEYSFGSEPQLIHKPDEDTTDELDGSDVTHAYAIAHFPGGGYQFEVMTIKELERIRKLSPKADSGPWKDHREQMYQKSVTRRLFKMLPVSLEMQQAVGADELADVHKQNPEQYLEGEYSEVKTTAQKASDSIDNSGWQPDDFIGQYEEEVERSKYSEDL